MKRAEKTRASARILSVRWSTPINRSGGSDPATGRPISGIPVTDTAHPRPCPAETGKSACVGEGLVRAILGGDAWPVDSLGNHLGAVPTPNALKRWATSKDHLSNASFA